MNRETRICLLWVAMVAAVAQPKPVGPDAVWTTAPDILETLRRSCGKGPAGALKKCFADGMAQNGASAEAVAFARGGVDVRYLQDFDVAGNIGIASVARPFRANDTDGILLVNASPAEIDVDDPSRFPMRDLERDTDYANLIRQNKQPLTLPADRSVADIEWEATDKGGQNINVEYRVAARCRACPTLGYARVAFEFDASGKLRQTRLVSFTLAGPEGEDMPHAGPAPLDMTSAPKLIQVIYEATREYKESKVLKLISEAQSLIAKGADLKALGPQKRTPLHWAVFGSAGAVRSKTLAAYEQLGVALLASGVDVNQEDQYQNTALDYLEDSPNHEMQTLLLEHGAVSGFFTGDVAERFTDLIEPGEASRQEGKARHRINADLMPGQTLSVRLMTRVSSQDSWTGDPIEAVVTRPLMDGDRTVLAPGTIIEGTVFYSQTAPNKYDRPLISLDFSNIVHPSGRRTPIFVNVTAVDNARESVRKNQILGIVQPHASGKTSIGLRLAGITNPAVGWAIEGARTAYGLLIRREIDYPVGTDLTLQVYGPSKLREKQNWKGWTKLDVDAGLEDLVRRSPVRTATPKSELSDLTNLMFIGSREQLENAFERAGWVNADRLNTSSALKTFQATIRKSGYETAPMSLLTIEGKAPDYEFQKGLNTFAKRHHLRVWKQPGQYKGRDIWVSSSTHDIGIGVEKGTKWFHRIDPHIDRERAKVQADLLFASGAAAYALVDRPRVPREARNATGDSLITDGQMLVLWLAENSAVAQAR